jgi:hypothetical protein
MNTGEVAAWVQATAGVATFVAAIVAVRASFDAPKLAAAFSENLRRQSQMEDRKNISKMEIFTTLMKHRATIAYEPSVNAPNLIPVIFNDDKDVLDALDKFLNCAGNIPLCNNELTEKYRTIIEKISKSLGLSGDVSYKDIKHFYHPELLAKAHTIANAELDERFKEVVSRTENS